MVPMREEQRVGTAETRLTIQSNRIHGTWFGRTLPNHIPDSNQFVGLFGFGTTALMFASALGDEPMARLLISRDQFVADRNAIQCNVVSLSNT